MPRKKTEELAIIPDTLVSPVDDGTEQPLAEENLPESMSEPVVEDATSVEDITAETVTPVTEQTGIAQEATIPAEDIIDGTAVSSSAEETEMLRKDAPTAETPPKRTTRKRTTVSKKKADVSAELPAADNSAQMDTVPTVIQQRDILTLDARSEAETQAQMEDIIWHEIHNGYRTRRILSGMLSGIEKTDGGKTIAIVDYKGFRIVIPMCEMVLDFPTRMHGADYDNMILRYQKILNKMLGAEVDFVIKGIEAKSRTVVASRKDAMLKKQQIYYLGKDSEGQYRIYDGRVVEARVIAVAEQVIRVEVFGVETTIQARDISWDWIGDAHDRYSVGDQVLVRVLEVDRTDTEHIRIRADIKSVSGSDRNDNLRKCRIQGKYAGKVTHVHKGVVYIRLSNGANAIAHSCYDRRRLGRKDDVSFVVTHLDEERGIAMGIITRIIKQHI